VQWSIQVFELATWHERGGLDNGPSKSAANAARQVVGTALWTGRTWVKWQHHGGRTWEHNWGLSKLLRLWDHATSLAGK